MQFTTTLAVIPAILASFAYAAPVAVKTPALKPRESGTLTIHNNCPFDVTVETVNQINGFTDEGTSTIGTKETWSHPLINYGDQGLGVTHKLSGAPGGQGVAQLEYTVSPDIGQTHYDLSLIDGNPFQNYAQTLVTSDPAAPSVLCPPGPAWCDSAYMYPDMNRADHGAVIGSNLDFYLC